MVCSKLSNALVHVDCRIAAGLRSAGINFFPIPVLHDPLGQVLAGRRDPCTLALPIHTLHASRALFALSEGMPASNLLYACI